MATELVSVSGRQAHVVKRNVHQGANSFSAVQVKFLDTGEICWRASTQVTPVGVEDIEFTLPLAEQEELDECEAVIARGLKTFVEVGNALLNIRDKKLYRAAYDTFEAYCQHRWDFSKSRANQLIAASETVANLTTIVVKNDTPEPVALPENEAQARPLTPLDPEDQRVIWQLVTESAPDGKVTAAHVKSVVSLLTQVGYTRAIDGGDGIDIPIEQATPDHFKAVLTEDAAERMARQQQYIAAKQKPRTKLFDQRGSLERVVHDLDWARFERLTDGRIVRLLLYVEEAE